MTGQIPALIAIVGLGFFISPSRPLQGASSCGPHNYTVVIDAGTSATRIFLYQWEPKSATPDIVAVPLVAPMELPFGVATLADHSTQTVGAALKPLLDHVVASLKPECHTATSLMFLGTTGLRALADEPKEQLLRTIRSWLTDTFPFKVDSVQAMSSAEEGLFTWLAINHAQGTLAPLLSTKATGMEGTVGTLWLGRNAGQMTYAVDHEAVTEDTKDSIMRVRVAKGAPPVSVFLHSMDDDYSKDAAHKALRLDVAKDPCLPRGIAGVAGAVDPGQYGKCREAISAWLGSTAAPKMAAVPAGMRFRALDHLLLAHRFFNLTGSAPLRQLTRSAQDVCGEWSWQQVQDAAQGIEIDDLRHTTCFLPAYMSSFLTEKYQFNVADNGILFSDEVDHRRVSFTLGAALLNIWKGELLN